MSILDRFITVNLARGWLLVFALLAVVFGLFAFIDELNHTTLNYQPLQALQFVLQTTPQRTLELFPIITLLGTLIAFATLSRSSELVIILSSGISASRLLASASLPALLLMLTLWPISEYIAAPLYQKAEAMRLELRTGFGHTLGETGLWSTNKDTYYHVGSLTQDLQPADIRVYQLDAQGRLTRALKAERANVVDRDTWQLLDVNIKRSVTDPKTGQRQLLTETEPTLLQGSFWSTEELKSLTLSPASMSLRNLYSHLKHLKTTGQYEGNLNHLFWQRATLPIAAAVMVLLALQLSQGMVRQRNQSFGWQVGMGVAIGLLFYLASQVIYAAGVLFKLDARLVAAIPILIVLAATALLHRRQQ